MLDARLGYSLWALRVAFGVQAVLFGLVRFNTPGTLTRLSGVVELGAGVLVFTPLTELAAYFLTGWLLLLALAAVGLEGAYGTAVCNVMLAAGAFALGRFTRLNEAEGPMVGRATAPPARRGATAASARE